MEEYLLILAERKGRKVSGRCDDECLSPVRGVIFRDDNVDDENVLKQEVLSGEYLALKVNYSRDTGCQGICCTWSLCLATEFSSVLDISRPYTSGMWWVLIPNIVG